MKTKLRKVSPILFEQDFNGPSGPSVFKWERDFELLRLELQDVQLHFYSNVEVAGLSDFVKGNSRVCQTSIQASGRVINDALLSLNDEGEIGSRFDEVKSINLRRCPDWEERLAELQKEQIEHARNMGVLRNVSANDAHFWDETEELWNLDVWVPAEQYDFIVGHYELLGNKAHRLTLIVRGAFFRSEVDRGLEEFDTPRKYHVNYWAPVFLESLQLSVCGPTPKEGSDVEKFFAIEDGEPAKVEADKPTNLPTRAGTDKWFPRIFFALVAIIFILLLRH
jgi:hypothetical protein